MSYERGILYVVAEALKDDSITRQRVHQGRADPQKEMNYVTRYMLLPFVLKFLKKVWSQYP
jgi:hypothetical protein